MQVSEVLSPIEKTALPNIVTAPFMVERPEENPFVLAANKRAFVDEWAMSTLKRAARDLAGKELDRRIKFPKVENPIFKVVSDKAVAYNKLLGVDQQYTAIGADRHIKTHKAFFQDPRWYVTSHADWRELVRFRIEKS